MFNADAPSIQTIVAKCALLPIRPDASAVAAVPEYTIGRSEPSHSCTTGGNVESVDAGTKTRNNPLFLSLHNDSWRT